MYITGTEVVRWLEALDPDVVVYEQYCASPLGCTITTYAKTLDERVEATAPSYKGEKRIGYVFENAHDQREEAIGTTTTRVARMMDAFDVSMSNVVYKDMTAKEALEIIQEKGL
jgi:hypothetical protein